MSDREDFRIWKLPERECCRVLRRAGSGWESLAWCPSRAEAHASIERLCSETLLIDGSSIDGPPTMHVGPRYALDMD